MSSAANFTAWLCGSAILAGLVFGLRQDSFLDGLALALVLHHFTGLVVLAKELFK